jgi:hypothetical protein
MSSCDRYWLPIASTRSAAQAALFQSRGRRYLGPADLELARSQSGVIGDGPGVEPNQRDPETLDFTIPNLDGNLGANGRVGVRRLEVTIGSLAGVGAGDAGRPASQGHPSTHPFILAATCYLRPCRTVVPTC